MKAPPWYLLDEVGVMRATLTVSRNGSFFIPTVSETDLVFQLT